MSNKTAYPAQETGTTERIESWIRQRQTAGGWEQSSHPWKPRFCSLPLEMLQVPRGERHLQGEAPTEARQPPSRQHSFWHSILEPKGEIPSAYSKPVELFFFHLNTPKGFHTLLSVWRLITAVKGSVIWEKSTTENHWDKTLNRLR